MNKDTCQNHTAESSGKNSTNIKKVLKVLYYYDKIIVDFVERR